MHRRWTVALLVAVPLALAGSASAQIPTKGNVFFGYSYNRAEIVSNDGTNLNGWNASLEGKFAPWVGLVADVGATYGSHVGEYNFLFGPRVSASVGSVRPFAELLIGAGHIGIDHGLSDTSFANAVGGGVDYRVAGPVAVRGQLDWIHTRFFSHGQNDYRFSTGLVLHF
jgi:opacity protein-like surface antigen